MSPTLPNQLRPNGGTGPRRAYWVLPQINPRRASLRYRCLYPMQVLQQRGRQIGFYEPANTAVDADTTLIFDAWTLFSSVSTPAECDRILAIAEALRPTGARIVIDNCDNQFAAQTTPPHWDEGLRRLQRLSELASVMVCCSEALVQAMRRHITAELRYVSIDDPIEAAIRYPGDALWRTVLSPARKAAGARLLGLRAKTARDRLRGRIPLVWFGSHGNHFSPGGMLDLLRLREPLHEIAKTQPLALTIISNHRGKFDAHFRDWGLPVHYLEWDRSSFIAALKLHELSLIPAAENEFTRCKSSNRLTLSVYHGLQVVADDIPSYRPFAGLAYVGQVESLLAEAISNRQRDRESAPRRRADVIQRNGLEAITDDWERLIYVDE